MDQYIEKQLDEHQKDVEKIKEAQKKEGEPELV
jgi:hypothetical protein